MVSFFPKLQQERMGCAEETINLSFVADGQIGWFRSEELSEWLNIPT